MIKTNLNKKRSDEKPNKQSGGLNGSFFYEPKEQSSTPYEFHFTIFTLHFQFAFSICAAYKM